tara:strand:+ start:1198 stop:1548 length:351 start_codon:yes stop_codon:yes gene_type:complete
MAINDFINNATKRKSKSEEISEADIEKEFCNYAKNKSCFALKLIYLNKKGFPDRTVLCGGGHIFFIEFKRKGKKQSPAQKITEQILKSFGFKYYVCDKKGQAESLLNLFLTVNKND